MKKLLSLFSLPLVLVACVGTSEVEDELEMTNPGDISVTLTADKTNLVKGEMTQLSYMISNTTTESFTPEMMDWLVSDESVLSVDDEGKLTALSAGLSTVQLILDEYKSQEISFLVDVTSVSGAFQNLHYEASGRATVEIVDGRVLLKLNENFQTELLLGTWIYMANSLEGASIKANGLAVANISNSLAGAQTFDLTSLKSTIGVADYKYVVVLCEPASISMAYAELN